MAVGPTTEPTTTAPAAPTEAPAAPTTPAIPTEHPNEAPRLTPVELVPGQALYRSVLHSADNVLPTWLLEAVATYVSLLNRCHYALSYLVLKRKEVFNVSVITLGPEMASRACIYELGVDSHLAASLLNTAL